MGSMRFRHADVCVLCASCCLYCILHDLQFVNVGRGCKSQLVIIFVVSSNHAFP